MKRKRIPRKFYRETAEERARILNYSRKITTEITPIMNSLSYQIRKLVRTSSFSSNVLAESLNMKKSAMSRFMKGGNLKMGKLDQLALILHVVVFSKASQVRQTMEASQRPILDSMSFLSDQIRELVKKLSISPNLIAKAANIKKSAMSRFLEGGTLKMGKIDKLVMVLGLRAVSERYQVRDELAEGSPSMEASQWPILEHAKFEYFATEEEANQCAEELAVDAHAIKEEGPWGVWPIGRPDTELLHNFLFYYNNNPYGGTLARMRGIETGRIVNELESIGIEVLAEGQAGEKLEGCDERYTIGLILGCPLNRQPVVERIIEDSLRQTSRDLNI